MKKSTIKIKSNEETLCCIWCGMPLGVYRYRPRQKIYGKSITRMINNILKNLKRKNKRL